jgi:hypothetical protein
MRKAIIAVLPTLMAPLVFASTANADAHRYLQCFSADTPGGSPIDKDTALKYGQEALGVVGPLPFPPPDPQVTKAHARPEVMTLAPKYGLSENLAWTIVNCAQMYLPDQEQYQ